VVHEERIRDTFRLVRALYRVDGRLVAAAAPGFAAPADRLAFDAEVPAGCHVVEAALDYTDGGVGYDYVVPVRVRASRAITVASGGAVARVVSELASVSVTTPLEERIATRVEAGAGPVPAVAEPPVVADLGARDGERVAVDATPAKYLTQHFVVGGPESHDTYLVPVGGEADFAARGAVAPVCPGAIHVIGKVVSFVGRSKRPGDATPVRESQLEIESWRCR
jgi:hypothetical protein